LQILGYFVYDISKKIGAGIIMWHWHDSALATSVSQR